MVLAKPVFGRTVFSLVSARIAQLKFIAAGVVLGLCALQAHAASGFLPSSDPWMASSIAAISAAQPHGQPAIFEVQTMARPGVASFIHHTTDHAEVCSSLALPQDTQVSVGVPAYLQSAPVPALVFLSEQSNTHMSLVESLTANARQVVSMKALFDAETPALAFSAFTLPQNATTPLFPTLAPTVAAGRNDELAPPVGDNIALTRSAS